MRPPWRYRLLVRLLSPALCIYTLWRSLKDGGIRYLYQRLGWYRSSPEKEGCTSIDTIVVNTHERVDNTPRQLWIHAASVGEVFTVLPLIKAVQVQTNNAPLLVTTGTPTGAAVLKQQALIGVRHQYLPLDFPGACTRFLKQAGVDEGWIVETEIWPWLYAKCAQLSVGLTVVNGRLSEKTTTQSKGILASSYRHALQQVRVLARSNTDLNNFIKLGALPENVQMAGNLKYAQHSSFGNLTSPLTRRYVLAASTHADEEQQLARHWQSTKNEVLLVIVPRHSERGQTITKQLREMGLHVSQRSKNEKPADNDKVYLADSLGELQAWYQGAIAAFVGGSLIRRGGHNMLEPARYACPTIVGPHTQNFDDIMQLLLNHDAITVGQDVESITRFLERASAEDDQLIAMGKRAQSVAENSQSVLQHYKELLFI